MKLSTQSDVSMATAIIPPCPDGEVCGRDTAWLAEATSTRHGTRARPATAARVLTVRTSALEHVSDALHPQHVSGRVAA